jgi:hypothetical protein
MKKTTFLKVDGEMMRDSYKAMISELEDLDVDCEEGNDGEFLYVKLVIPSWNKEEVDTLISQWCYYNPVSVVENVMIF